MPKKTAHLEAIDATTVRSWLLSGDTILIDVREDHEVAVERIAEAHQVALSVLDEAEMPEVAGKTVVFHCAGGKRTTDFADDLLAAAETADAVYQMDGGIEAWKTARLPVVTASTARKFRPDDQAAAA